MDGLGRSKLVRLVGLNKVQAVLSQICDYSAVSVTINLNIYGLLILESLTETESKVPSIEDETRQGMT